MAVLPAQAKSLAQTRGWCKRENEQAQYDAQPLFANHFRFGGQFAVDGSRDWSFANRSTFQLSIAPAMVELQLMHTPAVIC